MESYPEVDGSYVTGPYQLPASVVGDWSYNGKGHLTSSGATAEYTAPAQVPSQNPEAVSVQLKLSMPGVFQLISNITVMGDHHIDYLRVDETEDLILCDLLTSGPYSSGPVVVSCDAFTESWKVAEPKW
ncbi:MAG TPA: hypothetical protein VHD83_08160 [Puia sp.]|nr:hypothetical protein [Puia sp.]